MESAQIEKLAREAGAVILSGDIYSEIRFTNATKLTRFAELVAAHERERCALVCDAVAVPYQAAGASVATECANEIRNTASRSGG
jgi:hypothetical protein